jgi:hypothetical protein
VSTPTPPPEPTKFLVNVSIDWSYEVDADSPEDAASNWEYDQAAYVGECIGFSVESVTHPGDWNADDLRADVPCRGGCGKQLPASRNDECRDCLINRAKRENAEHAKAAS